MRYPRGFGGGFSHNIKLILAHNLKGKVAHDWYQERNTSPASWAALQQWARLQMPDVGVKH